MEHVIQFLLIYLIIPMFGPWIASTVSNLITTFVSYMPSIVLLSGLGAIIKFTYKYAQFKKIVALSNLIQRIYHNDIRNMLP